MAAYTETGITIDLTNFPHCRLKDCEQHKELSHYFFKEADFMWWDPQENCIYISDFKDLSEMTKGKDIEKLVPNLVEKSVHVLTVLASTWLGCERGKPYRDFFPEPFRAKQKVKIAHVVKCPAAFNAYFGAVNTQFRSRFYAFEFLFDVEEALVLNIENARKYLPVR